MTDVDESGRCLSSAEVLVGVLKRCQLPAGHEPPHRFVSAVDDAGNRLLAEWGDDKRVTAREGPA